MEKEKLSPEAEFESGKALVSMGNRMITSTVNTVLLGALASIVTTAFNGGGVQLSENLNLFLNSWNYLIAVLVMGACLWFGIKARDVGLVRISSATTRLRELSTTAVPRAQS